MILGQLILYLFYIIRPVNFRTLNFTQEIYQLTVIYRDNPSIELYSTEMGNKIGKQQDEFQKMVRSIKSKQSQSSGMKSKITINPQQKYLSVMIQKLSTSNLPEELKNKLSQTLHEKMSKQELIKTVSIANVLKNNQFDIQASKNTIINSSIGNKEYSTKNVKFNFDFTKINPYIKKNLLLSYTLKGSKQITKADLQNYQKQLTEQEKKKMQQQKQLRDSQIRNNFQLAMKILKQEIKKMYHPFWKLNKVFADYLANEFSNFLKSQESGCSKDKQKHQVMIRKLLYTWCNYLQDGCLYPYKKWLTSFLQMTQAKLSKYLQSMLLQQIFSINNSYLYHSIMMLISEHYSKLNIPLHILRQQQDLITPQLFSINQKLQIQGNFFSSTYECSQLQSIINKPEKILKQLQLLKNCMCSDVDQYYKLSQKQQYYYQIDSDNILGIVNFILTRIPNKIDAIYRQIIFLRVVYGDGVYFSHGISSYMLSTLSGSMQFLQSQEFMKLIKQNPLANKKPISPPTTSKGTITTNVSQQSIKQSTQGNHTSPTWSKQQKLNQYLSSSQSRIMGTVDKV